jgi:NAD(P)H-dependent FMN reductase
MQIAVLGGSLRKESLNRHLLEHLARTLAALGHEPSIVSGDALRLPLYDADLPAPADVLAVQSTLAGIQGLVIVSPEYNAGIPPHLKNVVDWLSTLTPNPLKGIPVLLAAASPGAFGGSRALLSWRPVLANLGALVLPGAITVPLADKNLDPAGAPLESRAQGEIQKALAAFLDLTTRLANTPT